MLTTPGDIQDIALLQLLAEILRSEVDESITSGLRRQIIEPRIVRQQVGEEHDVTAVDPSLTRRAAAARVGPRLGLASCGRLTSPASSRLDATTAPPGRDYSAAARRLRRSGG